MPIARLIADLGHWSPTLEAETRAMREAGFEVEVGEAVDGVLELAVSGEDCLTIANAIDAAFAPDACLVSAVNVQVPQLFVSDMDSTMIGQECIDELADFAGIKHQIAAITERAMQGELDFENALRERVLLLRDLSEDAITECLDTRIEPIPGAKTLVETLKSKGCRTVLVTGGFHHFADPVAGLLGFDRVVGNRLVVENGSLTGGLHEPITDSAVKKAVLLEELAELGAGAVSLATGDGANDIPMLEAADYGFAFRAKPKARAAANGRIDRGDLTAILRLLGIPQAEWVTG